MGLVSLLGGCAGGALDVPEDAGHAPLGNYNARLLPSAHVGRVAISKRDATRGVCAWILIAESPNSVDTITAPAGWVEEGASINAEAATCFTQQLPAAGF
jgi:hypothetical protein